MSQDERVPETGGFVGDILSAEKKPARRTRWAAAGFGLLAAVSLGGALSVPALRAIVLGSASSAVGMVRNRFSGDPVMERPDPVRGVRVFTVEEHAAQRERSFTGVVAARYETAVGFRVGGKILARAVEVGQAVQAGDLLFALDPADYRAAVSAAEANLAAEQAQAAQAAADRKRQAQLLAQGWTTQAAYDRAEATAEAASNQARAASDRLVLARNDLAYAQLRAPTEGIVTALRAESGQVVPVGQPVLTLVRPGEREALVNIPEGQVAEMAAWSATASFWGRPGAPEAAVLREIAPQADPASRTYAVRFSLPDSAANAQLGSTVTVHLSRTGAETSATIPATSVLFRRGTPIVWRVVGAGSRVEAVPVTIERLGAETADVGGLASGDRIVSLGVHRLDEGMRIRVVEAVRASRAPDAQGGRS